jgi:membrane-bound hydrogenase subunit beta
MAEAKIISALEAWFPFLVGKATAPRARRVFADVPAESFHAVLEECTGDLGFDRLVAITGLDDKDALGAVYALGRRDGVVLALKLSVPRDTPVIDSVTDRFPGAANYERELVDLFGFEVRNLPPGRRYPLPDDWPVDQKPLRKDWKPAPKA